MKLMLRIFNLVFIGLCATALILLFTLPSFSLYSNVGIDVKKISSFVPETKYTKDLDISEMIGTDTIYVEIDPVQDENFHNCNTIVEKFKPVEINPIEKESVQTKLMWYYDWKKIYIYARYISKSRCIR